MTIFNLDKIFRPDAVAVVGASERPGSIGKALLDNLQSAGFAGSIFPVNPHYHAVNGLKCYPSLSGIKQPVAMAVVATPIAAVPAVIEECGQAGIRAAVIISAGGKEIGSKGRDLEERIKQLAERSGIRIVGPNCLGVVCAQSKLNASFASHMPLPGKLAFVSQSGAICTAILDVSLREHIGFSYFVSVGSMLDVDFGDLVNYLGNDPEVTNIVLYIECLSNFRNFMSAARAVSRIKPIIVLKSGRSAAGARAAASHTGALAGDDAVYDAAFERCGIVRVQTIEELFDCAGLMARQPRPKGQAVGIITNAGGPGVMAADALANYGLEPVALRTETLEKLNAFLLPYWSRGNPIDILGDASPERYRKAVEVCLSAPEINGLLIIMAPQALTDPTAVAASLAEVLRNRATSVFTVWMGAADVERGRDIFNQAGIPTYETPERAVKAFLYMYGYARNLRMLQEIPPRLPADLRFDRDAARAIMERALSQETRLLGELESKMLLAAYGIPVNLTELTRSPGDAVVAAQRIGYPVVLKIHSPDITHKSDAGGVLLDLQHAMAVEQGYERIMRQAAKYAPHARLLGVTVQPMLPRQEYELILGSKRNSDFGPVLLFGLGGVLTEILKDRAIALPPLNRLLARRLIAGTRVYELLQGYRGLPSANLLLLEEILIRLSQLVIDFPEIEELDINPMLAIDDRMLAVDARVLIQPTGVASPLHLAISPYPGQYERKAVIKDGTELLIRPIKPEDAPLLVEMFRTLSPTSIYFRFFRPLRSLSEEMLARFTQIDYDRDMALVAMQQHAGGEKMLGVARLMSDPDVTEAEFSIVVSDPWQGKGVGAILLEDLIAIARERGMASLWGIVLPENTTMLALGRKVGFVVKRIPGDSDYELRIDLKPAGRRSESFC